jgi:hypothetical protein
MTTYRINHRFTDRIAKHGPWSDNTLTAATKQKSREKFKSIHRFDSMNKLVNEFNEQLELIKKSQLELATEQKRMAENALRNFCCIVIQNSYRLWISIKKLKRLKAIRFLTSWIKFRVFLKIKHRASCKISLLFFRIHNRKKFRLVVLRFKAAIKIIKYLVSLKKKRDFFIKIKLLCTVKSTMKHIMLFGTRRAYKFLINRNNDSSQNSINFASKKILSVFYRRKRLKMYIYLFIFILY